MTERPRTLLLLAGWCAFAFLVLLALAYGWPAARRLDATALEGFVGLRRPGDDSVAGPLSALGNPAEVALITLGLAALALARHQPRLALAAIVLIGVTSVSSQLLKAWLAYPRHEALVDGVHLSPAAFPSGHATAVMSIALAGVLVAPRRARPLAALVGAAYVLAVSYSILELGWHFPSDVVGGFLLASGWMLAIAAALRAAEERWPERSGRTCAAAAIRAGVDSATTVGLALAGVFMVVAAIAGALLLLPRGSELLGFAEGRTSVVVVGLAVGVAAAVLLASVTAVLSRR